MCLGNKETLNGAAFVAFEEGNGKQSTVAAKEGVIAVDVAVVDEEGIDTLTTDRHCSQLEGLHHHSVVEDESCFEIHVEEGPAVDIEMSSKKQHFHAMDLHAEGVQRTRD